MSSSDKTEEKTVPQERLKQGRSSSAGWLTRSMNQWSGKQWGSVVVIEMHRDRISSQMKRLQQFHDEYMAAITDDTEAGEAEEWMDKYLQRTAEVLADMEEQINALRASATSTENKPTLVKDSDNEKEKRDTDPSGSRQHMDSKSDESPAVVRPIDAWIDDLVIGLETSNPNIPGTSDDLSQALARMEMDRDLPKVTLPVFEGSPLLWPRFIEQFYVQVHSRPCLTDVRRMDLLQSHVAGDAKKLIQGLGFSGRNYVQSIKELKFAFGHRAAVAQAYVNSVTSGSVVPSGDPAALRSFYISVRDCITTLEQMNYTGELCSSDVLQRTSQRIPNDKRGKWNEYIRHVYQDREPSLRDLMHWLKQRVEADFNPYAVAVNNPKPHSVSRTTVPQPIYHTTLNTSAEAQVQQPLVTFAAYVGKVIIYLDVHFIFASQLRNDIPISKTIISVLIA